MARKIALSVYVVLLAAAAWPASDSIVASWPAPGYTVSGMAFGGGVLYLADPPVSRIYRIDPDTHSVIGSYQLSLPGGAQITGLGYGAGYLWADTGYDERLYRLVPTSGSITASFPLAAIGFPDGIGADAGYIYVANNSGVQPYIYKLSQGDGSVVQTWTTSVHTKYPAGLDIITRVPSSTEVVLNLGSVDGWVHIYDLSGNRYEGEQFLIAAPCPPSGYGGDLATKDDTHFYFGSSYNNYIYEIALDWYGQEEDGVAPASFGKVKALYR